MKGLAVIPLTLQSIRGHDVLLDVVHDLFNSIVESSYQHNREPNGYTLRRVWGCRGISGIPRHIELSNFN